MVDGLLEIALAIEQADPDKTQPEVGGGLGMVAGKDAQTTGGNRQGFMKAEFSGEIGDGPFEQLGGILAAPGVLFPHVGVEHGDHAADTVGELGFLQANPQLVVGDLMQDGDGVVVKVLPATGRKVMKKILGFLIPCPP